MKLLIVGATGLVGRHVLEQALADDNVTGVVAPARRALAEHPKLFSPVVDFDDLTEEESWWQADAVICTLGTTMRVAGSKEAFRKVDHEYPLHVARLAKFHGTPTFVLNSAMGADPSSRFFYNQVKGELERDLRELEFPSLTLVRPGLIGGERDEFRAAEKATAGALKILGPLLPRAWRINLAETIAASLLGAAQGSSQGVHVVASRDLI